MGRGRLIVTEQEHARSLDRCETEFVSPLEFARLARNGHWLKRIAGYRETGLIAAQPWLRPRLFALVLLLWLLGRGNCWLQDLNGKVARVRFATLLCLLGNLLRDAAAVPWALHCVRREVRELQAWAQLPRLSGRLGAARPLYLKTDLWFETLAGGSVSHMAGVINHMPEYFAAPLVLATACNPLLRENFEFKQILPECRYWDFRDLPSLMFSSHLRKTVELACGERAPGFIYQRCNLNNYAALWLARDWGVPLISEYNGSEVWIENHWGGRRNGNRLSEAIERLNLDAADLIVVVSNALQDELTHIGIPASRILVNPNGVDLTRYRPEIDASAARATLGLQETVTIGFIGTFGPWHGVEVLIRAFAELQHNWCNGQMPRLKLLLIGDGARRPHSESLAMDLGIAADCIFTGTVPQAEGPKYLACCDVLVAPHVPNPDDSVFFGSPVKLFEYMAMGRAIAASELGQIGEVIADGKTGLLVQPDNAQQLSQALGLLVRDPALRTRLGLAARRVVEEHYSWQTHVGRIATAIRERRL